MKFDIMLSAIKRGAFFMINSEKIEVLEVFDKFEEKLEKGVSNLKGEYAKLKAGRANAHVLDKIYVDYYGTPTPIKQLGNISVPEARILMISVWDVSALKAVEKAINEANIGINPQNDGKVIRLIFPELTEARRKELCKEIKAMGENTKIALRNARRDANDAIRKLKKDNVVTEDEVSVCEKEIDKMLAEAVAEVDKSTKDKEQEVMTV